MAQKSLMAQSPLIIESAFKNIMTTDKKLIATPEEIIDSPVLEQ